MRRSTPWARHPWWMALAFSAMLTACSSAPSTLPSTPGIRARVDTVYYPVEGTTRRDWLTGMREGAAAAGVTRPYLATTSWQMHWSYASSRLTPRGCEAVAPLVDVEVHYVIPRLVSDSAAAQEDVIEWRRYLYSLWRHEEGHAARALRAGSEMRDSLHRIRTPVCLQLSPVESRALEQVLTKYRALQAEYDRRTQHGARQGALLIPDSRARISVDTTYRDTLP